MSPRNETRLTTRPPDGGAAAKAIAEGADLAKVEPTSITEILDGVPNEFLEDLQSTPVATPYRSKTEHDAHLKKSTAVDSRTSVYLGQKSVNLLERVAGILEQVAQKQTEQEKQETVKVTAIVEVDKARALDRLKTKQWWRDNGSSVSTPAAQTLTVDLASTFGTIRVV